jgi:ATP-dependent exoDNAse (exonuclease V) alpha subunit
MSGKQMERITERAKRQGCRVILVGDTKQIQSVEAGDALRILEKESRLKSIALTEVERKTRAD